MVPPWSLRRWIQILAVWSSPATLGSSLNTAICFYYNTPRLTYSECHSTPTSRMESHQLHLRSKIIPVHLDSQYLSQSTLLFDLPLWSIQIMSRITTLYRELQKHPLKRGKPIQTALKRRAAMAHSLSKKLIKVRWNS